MEKKSFNKDVTNVCKGVALIFLLWHHLFYAHPEYGFISYKLAILSKVCVAIFIILSGYGLSESVKTKNIGLFAFYKKRLINLYFNYWFIAFIFVSIGTLFMDRTFQSVFGNHFYLKFFIQMTGLHRFIYNDFGYNATWWYMSVIIPLTILFPFIYDLTEKYGTLILAFCFLILLPKNSIFPVINEWLLPFTLGIYLSQKNYIICLSNYLSIFGQWRFLFLFSSLLIIAKLRSNIPFLESVEIDWLFGGLIILCVFEICTCFKIINNMLGFLGKHLFNIFLFHTFIYLYYWKNIVYFFKNPFFIFLTLLFISILISFVLEKIKKLLFFYNLIEKFNKWQIPPKIEIAFR